MTGKDERYVNRQFDRFRRRLPRPLARVVHWLSGPSARWLRIPLGVIFIVGGLLWFLPVVGFWMLPLGLLLLALDLPALRRPLRRLMVCTERRWKRWRHSHRNRQP